MSPENSTVRAPPFFSYLGPGWTQDYQDMAGFENSASTALHNA